MTRYYAKLNDMQVIWERLQLGVEGHEEFMEWLASIAKHPENESQEKTQEMGTRRELKTRGLHLDIEDFYIHSRILMDRVAAIIGYLLPGSIRNPDHASFHDLRKFFGELGNIPYGQDEEFAKYMREKTGWFDALLRDYRDLLVVHNSSFQPSGMVSGPSMAPRLIRVRAGRGQSGWMKAVEKLETLQKKYQSEYGAEVPEVVPNYPFPTIDFFDAKADELDPADLKVMRSIKMEVGGYLPDVSQLADKIIGFLAYCGGHFQKNSNPG